MPWQKYVSYLIPFVFLSVSSCDNKPSSSTQSPSANLSLVETSPDQRRLLGLIDYLAGDYPGAVVGGLVVSEPEYDEMKEFAATALKLGKSLYHDETRETKFFLKNLEGLVHCVEVKCAHSEILRITKSLKTDLVKKFSITSEPVRQPNLDNGRKVFLTRCASCHGDSGKADGPLSASLNPPPRNFQDPKYLEQASPFKFVNTLHIGIEGTSMLSFEKILKEEDMWDVSFYILALRHFNVVLDVKDFISFMPSLSFLSRSTDLDLQDWLRMQGFKGKSAEQALSFFRARAPYWEDIRLGGDRILEPSSWSFIRERIGASEKEFDRKNFQESSGILLDAYLDGFEKMEAALAVKDHSLLLELERTFSIARTYASRGQVEEYKKILPKLLELTALAEKKLTASPNQKTDSMMWSSTDFISSLVIILREGFEAFLIIIALLMIVGNFNRPEAKIWVHAGWVSACIVGLISYFVFEFVLKISGSTRESIEAFCTLLATIVLFYTGFWLLSHAEHAKWQQYIKQKTNEAITSKKLWVLFGISFLAVFRESAETVLFYAALFSNAQNTFSVVVGFFTGLLILSALCLTIMKYHIRIPLRGFFLGTSTFMVALSIVLAGKTVYELIAAGYLKANPIEGFPMIDLLGIYPLKETLFLQCFLLVLTGILLILKKRKVSS